MNTTFWFDEIFSFKDSTVEKKMNTITIYIICVFLLSLFFVPFKLSVFFLVSCLLFIIILYYKQKRMKETFEPRKIRMENGNAISKRDMTICDSSDKYVYGEFIDSTLDNINNPNYPIDFKSPTLNQSLAGTQSLQKNKERPVIAPRSLDIEAWRKDNSYNHSQVNSESAHDMIQSGYISSIPDTACVRNPVIENYEYMKIKKYTDPVETYNNVQGYYLENKNLNLPLNYKNTMYDTDATVNKNIYTQLLQPKIYTHSDTIEPPISNLGISYATPNSIKEDVFQSNGELIHEIHDPSLYKEFVKPELPTVNESSVYDPRFTGYGTSYRGYTDNLNGQPKFFYDDVNSVRMPNFIIRSNIDFMKSADSYGSATSLYDPKMSRQSVNDSFTDNALQFRNEMSERLLRKRNNELWATRKYPLGRQNTYATR